MLKDMVPIAGVKIDVTPIYPSSVEHSRSKAIVNNVFDSLGLKRLDDTNGNCKLLLFCNSKFHFALMSNAAIGGQEYHGRLYLGPHIRQGFGLATYIHWKIEDFIRLVNCSISLETFLSNCIFIIRDTKNTWLVENKGEIVEAMIHDIFVLKLKVDISLS